MQVSLTVIMIHLRAAGGHAIRTLWNSPEPYATTLGAPDHFRAGQRLHGFWRKTHSLGRRIILKQLSLNTAFPETPHIHRRTAKHTLEPVKG